MNESGFRSYFREHAPAFALLEPGTTYESSDVARQLTNDLFSQYPDLRGLFVSGGGITGVLASIREQPKRQNFISVAYDLIGVTRTALIDGTLTMVISHPLQRLAHETMKVLINLKKSDPASVVQHINLGFEIYTAENV